jgi:integrase
VVVEFEIKQYLESKKLAWANSTQRSERYRLLSLASVLTGEPHVLWSHLEAVGMAPYTRVTAWTRVTEFWQWMLDEGKVQGRNEYQKFRKTNARLFKNTYNRQPARYSFKQAVSRISRIRQDILRTAAEKLLTNGLRISEIRNLRDGQVTGKGNKSRKYFGQVIGVSVPEHQLREALGRVGLKPHDLRKICASELVKRGASPFELREIMGWSSVETAMSYVKLEDKRLEQLVKSLKK